LLIAAICPPQHLPAAKFNVGEVLLYKLDAVGADVAPSRSGWRRLRPGRSSARPCSSARAPKTNAFVATQPRALRRIRHRADRRATSTPLHYREDLDENDLHKGTEVAFPPQEGTLAVQATKNGEPEPFNVQADDGVRDMISTLTCCGCCP